MTTNDVEILIFNTLIDWLDHFIVCQVLDIMETLLEIWGLESCEIWKMKMVLKSGLSTSQSQKEWMDGMVNFSKNHQKKSEFCNILLLEPEPSKDESAEKRLDFKENVEMFWKLLFRIIYIIWCDPGILGSETTAQGRGVTTHLFFMMMLTPRDVREWGSHWFPRHPLNSSTDDGKVQETKMRRFSGIVCNVNLASDNQIRIFV